MDRYTRFANTWKAVGVTSRVRWQHQDTIDRFNALLVKNLMERYGGEARELLASVSYQIGLEDGRKIAETLNIDPSAPGASLIPLETIALLSGANSEVSGDRRSRQFPQLAFKSSGCIFPQIFEGLEADAKEIVCEKYSQGLAQAINKDAEVQLLRKCCRGNRQCEFMVTLR